MRVSISRRAGALPSFYRAACKGIYASCSHVRARLPAGGYCKAAGRCIAAPCSPFVCAGVRGRCARFRCARWLITGGPVQSIACGAAMRAHFDKFRQIAPVLRRFYSGGPGYPPGIKESCVCGLATRARFCVPRQAGPQKGLITKYCARCKLSSCASVYREGAKLFCQGGGVCRWRPLVAGVPALLFRPAAGHVPA